MKHIKQKIRDQISARFFFATVFFTLFAISAKANPLDLATIPLANSPTVNIQPNLLFVLDDSGSMAWNFMPDQFGYDLNGQDNLKCRINVRTANNGSTSNTTKCSGGNQNGIGIGGDPPIYSAKVNTVYYNPEITYEPPVNPCNLSARLPSQTNWSQVLTDGLLLNNSCGQTSSTANIVSQYPERVYCNASGTATLNSLPNTCRRNGIDAGNPEYTGDYDYPDNTITNRTWYGVDTTAQFGTYRFGRNFNSNPHYYNLLPREHCTDSKLINCVLSGTPTATHPVPAFVRYCNTDTFASNLAAVTGLSGTTPRCQAAFDNGTHRFARYGNFQRVDIIPSKTSYPKYAGRRDCAGATCSYNEEMTNFANWYAYYRTRMQMMKTSSGLAFKDIGEDFRIGFMTIKPAASTSLRFDTFNTAHKSNWFKRLYSINGSGGTPLRSALSTAGRIYAARTNISGAIPDPVEYECQQNYTLLTTDGFWNGAGGVEVNGSTAIGNMDGAGTPRPLYEGPTASSNSLADVAKYYFDTDLRTPNLNNCIGANGLNVCQSPPPASANIKQNMVTLTLGLGVDGRLGYTTDYKTATSGDFFNIKNGSANWPPPVGDTPTAIDDLWHGAVNGGGTYFSAKNPADLVSQLQEALATIEVKLGAGAAAATSTLNPVTGDNAAYVASYTTGFWTGNLEKRNIDVSTGAVGLSAVSCVEDVVIAASCSSPSSVVADGSGGYNCVTPNITDLDACTGTLDGTDCKVPVSASCGGSLKNRVSDFSDTRNIYMKVGSGLGNFSFGNMTATQRATYAPSFLSVNLTQWPSLTEAQKNAATGNNLVNYLRGQTGYEDDASEPDNRVFRRRQAVLGDIIDSTPAFVGKPTFSYTDPGYEAFKSDQTGRARNVYAGSNDGMLHAFDADTLQERWAYVPSMVIPNMWKLADTAYSTKHGYYANGEPIISDICVSGCNGAGAVWRTILVAGLKGGGRGYYALDITNPTSPSLLWEVDTNNEPNLGYTYGSPVVTKRPDGRWVVLITSGYNNIPDNSTFYNDPSTKFKPNNPALYNTGDGRGYLYVLDAVSGTKLAQISTGVGTQSNPSGLAQIQAYSEDAERNNTATYVYGGDLQGNLWRFDISNNTVMRFAQLLNGSTPQPITTRPELGAIKNKRILFIGTGKYLEISDLTNDEQQTLYGIKDDNIATTLINPKTQLVQQTIVPAGAGERTSGTNNGVNFDTGLGWYVDFPDTGERQNVPSQLVLGTLLVPTTVPTSSACQPAGYGWFNFFDYRTGLSVIQPSGLVSKITTSPIVGFNVVYVDGKPRVSVVTADNPTPQLIPDIPFSGSGTGFQKTRAIWREMLP
jgi:type IV pilus assembly protein PilY1